MIKTFALVAVIYSGDVGNAYVLDEGMSGADCIAALELIVSAPKPLIQIDASEWKALKAGDSLQCEFYQLSY